MNQLTSNVRVFPAMRSAYPSEWVKTLDRALAMDVDIYVPGHGFVEQAQASREELVEFQKAYQATSRVIAVLDSLVDEVMGLLR